MLKKIIWGLLGLLLLYVLVVWSGVLPRSTDAQIKAVNLLQQPYQYAVGKHDAFPQLWLINYDIPEAEVASAYSEDLQKYHEATQANAHAFFETSVGRKYQKLEFDVKGFCPKAPASCLAFVRANPDKSRELNTRYAAMHQRIGRLRESDHVRFGFEHSYFSPLPPLQGIGQVQILSSALDFVDGNRDRALDAACQDLSTWRRLGSHTDMLVFEQVLVRWGKEEIGLLADMMAELPADYPLPPSCNVALADPKADAFDRCDVARGEMQEMFGYMELVQEKGFGIFSLSEEKSEENFAGKLVFHLINLRAGKARMAPYLASLCAGQPMPEDNMELGMIEKIFDPVGVEFTTLAIRPYHEYKKRVEDFSGLLQTLRTLVWLRGQTDLIAASLNQPDEFRPKHYELIWDNTKKNLSISLQVQRNGEEKIWALPMPASRIAVSDAAIAKK